MFLNKKSLTSIFKNKTQLYFEPLTIILFYIINTPTFLPYFPSCLLLYLFLLPLLEGVALPSKKTSNLNKTMFQKSLSTTTRLQQNFNPNETCSHKSLLNYASGLLCLHCYNPFYLNTLTLF